jgi:hypothetical protein
VQASRLQTSCCSADLTEHLKGTCCALADCGYAMHCLCTGALPQAFTLANFTAAWLVHALRYSCLLLLCGCCAPGVFDVPDNGQCHSAWIARLWLLCTGAVDFWLFAAWPAASRFSNRLRAIACLALSPLAAAGRLTRNRSAVECAPSVCALDSMPCFARVNSLQCLLAAAIIALGLAAAVSSSATNALHCKTCVGFGDW